MDLPSVSDRSQIVSKAVFVMSLLREEGKVSTYSSASQGEMYQGGRKKIITSKCRM